MTFVIPCFIIIELSELMEVKLFITIIEIQKLLTQENSSSSLNTPAKTFNNNLHLLKIKELLQAKIH